MAGTLIYRVENPAGKGPYRAECAFSDELCDRHTFDGRRPAPVVDGSDYGKDMGDIDWYARQTKNFGFLDLDALRQWFTSEECEELNDHNFVVALYFVEEIYWIGDSGQLCYNPEKATRSGWIHPLSVHRT